MPGPREDRAAVLGRLVTSLRRPALAYALAVGLVVAGVLAIPWFDRKEPGAPRIHAVSEVDEPRAPARPSAEAEKPEAPPAREEAPAAAKLHPVAALDVPDEAPVYRPDAALAGGSLANERSEPGIRMGVASGLPEIRALGPEHVGATTSAAPTLYWFLSGVSSVPVEITLTLEGAAGPLVELRVAPPIGAGLHAVRLERRGVALAPGATYRWSVALVPDAANRDADLVSGAAVRRVVASAALTEQLAASGPGERAHVLAAAGYWYDAFDTLTRWIQAEPDAERLREHRAALLDQVGLAGVAALLPAPLPVAPQAAD
jgi:hypothetical protein